MDFSKLPEILKGFFTGAKKDMVLIPHTAISAVLLWIAMWGIVILGYFVILPTVALAQVAGQQVQSLDTSIKELKASLLVERWERQIKEMEDKLFTLSIDIDLLKRRKADVPVAMLSQVDQVSREKAALQRKLDTFTTKNAHLLEPEL